MSVFSAYSQRPAGAMTGQQSSAVTEAENQIWAFTDLYNRMTETCYAKCIATSPLKEGDLNVGETTCIDRCVAKFTRTQVVVGEKLEQFQKEQVEAQARIAAVQQPQP